MREDIPSARKMAKQGFADPFVIRMGMHCNVSVLEATNVLLIPLLVVKCIQRQRHLHSQEILMSMNVQQDLIEVEQLESI